MQLITEEEFSTINVELVMLCSSEFWGHSPVGDCQRSGRTHCLHPQGRQPNRLRCQDHKDHNINIHCQENLKSKVCKL